MLRANLPWSVTLIRDVQPIDRHQIETLERQFRHGNMLKLVLTIRSIEEIGVVIVHGLCWRKMKVRRVRCDTHLI